MKKIIAFLLLANIIWLNSCSLVLKSARYSLPRSNNAEYRLGNIVI